MKTLLLGSVALGAVAIAATAQAADIRPLTYRAPAAYDWTGCYVGIHAGGGVQHEDQVTRTVGAGALAGGQVGCNYQSGPIVIGIEAEGWWSGLSSSRTQSDVTITQMNSARNRSDFDIALRAGLAVDRVLVYGKAGVAWGRFDFNTANTFGIFSQGDGTLSGLLAGIGLEYAFADNWTAKLEYDYISYYNRDVHFDFRFGPFVAGAVESSISATKHIAKAGINYKFGGPVAAPAAMPVKAPVYKAPPSAFYSWTGCYLGVHAGAGAMYDQFTSINGRGALAGGQLGCNYQSGVLVAGIEAEGWSGLQSRLFQSQTIGGVLVASAETTGRNRWDAAVALRGGDRSRLALQQGRRRLGRVGLCARFQQRYVPTRQQHHGRTARRHRP
jgi:outer membrane immunogenic protein